jgi:hypothetical protein
MGFYPCAGCRLQGISVLFDRHSAGEQSIFASGFEFATGIAFDSAGYLYVSAGRIPVAHLARWSCYTVCIRFTYNHEVFIYAADRVLVHTEDGSGSGGTVLTFSPCSNSNSNSYKIGRFIVLGLLLLLLFLLAAWLYSELKFMLRLRRWIFRLLQVQALLQDAQQLSVRSEPASYQAMPREN